MATRRFYTPETLGPPCRGKRCDLAIPLALAARGILTHPTCHGTWT